jgi:peroxiredoxin Q/BCP
MLNQSGLDKMQQAVSKVQVGDLAPDFSLPDPSNNLVHFADLVKQNIVVLYFYPKDFSMGCTAEACTFRDNYEAFQQAGVTVVGLSSDSVESHQAFVQRHHLPFLLLSDVDGSVQKTYGVQGLFADFFPGRITYIIDRRGIVRNVFSSRVNMRAHVSSALKIVKSLQNEPS